MPRKAAHGAKSHPGNVSPVVLLVITTLADPASVDNVGAVCVAPPAPLFTVTAKLTVPLALGG
jgi:hypothetical protein